MSGDTKRMLGLVIAAAAVIATVVSSFIEKSGSELVTFEKSLTLTHEADQRTYYINQTIAAGVKATFDASKPSEPFTNGSPPVAEVTRIALEYVTVEVTATSYYPSPPTEQLSATTTFGQPQGSVASSDFLAIREPIDNATVAQKITVTGSGSQAVLGPEEASYLNVVVIAPTNDGSVEYYVQNAPSIEADGTWTSSGVAIGRIGSHDIGQSFQICPVLSDQQLTPGYKPQFSMPIDTDLCVVVKRG